MVRILTIFLSLSLLFSLAHAEVTLKADRTVLNLNESLSIELIQSDASGGQPDLSILEKDFRILSQSQSQQYNIVNGRTSQKKVWALELLPKKAGEVIIPSIQVGKEKSLPLHLVIHKSEPSTLGNNKKANVFIQVAVTPNKEVYVQQKVDLSIQIFYRINLTNLALSELKIDKVILEKSGEDKQYTKTIDQKTYQVIERHYALYPQESGLLVIPPIRFEALATSNNRSTWPFFAQRGKSIFKQSEDLSLTILPKPSSYTAKHWLPAEHIQVISEHSDLSQIKVGDSITITDKIIAKGLSGSILPEIPFKATQHIKIYPDKAIIDNQEQNGFQYGLREQKTAIIPTRSGNFTLPSREFVWWNSSKKKIEKKIIPGFQFNVLAPDGSLHEQQVTAQEKKMNSIDKSNQRPSPAVAQSEKPLADQLASSLEKLKNNGREKNPESLSAKAQSTNIAPSNSMEQQPLLDQLLVKNLSYNIWFWAWVATIVLAIFIILYQQRKFKNLSASNSEDKTMEETAIEKILTDLKQQAKKNKAKESYQLFLQWANEQLLTHQNQSISDIKYLLKESELLKQLELLENSLYAGSNNSWKGIDFLNALTDYIKQNINNHQNHKAYISPLNPL